MTINYTARCPFCKWELEDDVYYQIKDKKVYPLEVAIVDDKENVVSIVPKKVFEDLKVYPELIESETVWKELHHCPQCDLDFEHYLVNEEA